MDKVHVIVNPFSARGKTRKRWEQIKAVIKTYYREFKYIFTEKPRHATEIARELLKDGFDLIIGVGGDGTLNEIANGFFHSHSSQAINRDASVGMIPSGTGSDFIRFMKIPRDFKESMELINRSKKRKIDIGKITATGSAGEKVSNYFVNVADFGLGAEVVQRLSEKNPLKRGAFTYYRGMLSSILNYRSKRIRIEIDKQKTIEGRFLIGAIANGKIFGGGMIIAPEAEPDDGYLDLVLIDEMKTLEVINNSRLLYSGQIGRNPKVHMIKAKNIKVFADDDVRIEYDGEMGDRLPAEFEVVEKAVNFRI